MFRRISKAFCSVSPKIKNFEVGQYPSCFNYSRPFSMTRSKKGICVCTEHMDSDMAQICFYINCGSRNQTVQSSGTAHFVEHLQFKGTMNRRKDQLQLEVESLGGVITAFTTRENTCFSISIAREHIKAGIAIVGDMVTNSVFRAQDVENERSTIERELEETRISMPLETTLEMAHLGIYPNNQLGLPILGTLNNIQTISQQMILDYHAANYTAKNIYVCVVGNVSNEEVVKYVDEYVNVVRDPNPSSSFVAVRNDIVKPRFQGGVSTKQFSDMEKIRLDSMKPGLSSLVNMVVVREAPSFFDPNFFNYLLLQRIIADRPQNPLELEFMKKSSLFKFQNRLAKIKEIKTHKGYYSSYWDTGIFGEYFHFEPKAYKNVVAQSLKGYQEYTKGVTNEELDRSKRKLFVETLHQETQELIAQGLLNNVLYYGRRVHMKEIAERISMVSIKDIEDTAQKILDETKNMHVMLWGNVQGCKL